MSDTRDAATNAAISADFKSQERGDRDRELSVYTCPDCGGALWQVDNAGVLTFSCHIGHDFAADTLVVAKSHTLRQAVSEAVRTLKEKATLLRQLSLKANPNSETTAMLIEQADQEDEHARVLQSQLLEGGAENPSIDTALDTMARTARESR